MSEVALTGLEDIAPDSIEPYVGFKYLKAESHGGIPYLISDSGFKMVWPKMARAEAQCKTENKPYEWLALKHPPQDRYWRSPSTDDERTVAAVRTSNLQYGGILYTGHALTPLPPKTSLPEGYEWYWVEVPHEPASNERCACGIHVVSDPKHCEHYRRDNSLLVEVALWGNVTIASHGARGQFAYPKAIYATKKDVAIARRLGEAYGVPVITEDSTDENAAADAVKAALDAIEQPVSRSRGEQQRSKIRRRRLFIGLLILNVLAFALNIALYLIDGTMFNGTMLNALAATVAAFAIGFLACDIFRKGN